jgi:acetoin utilization deacetylase AcuC-like enzyme
VTEVIDVFFDERVLAHDAGSGVFEAGPSPLVAVPELHPENAERLANMRAILERGPLAPRLRWHPGRLAEQDELETVHDAAYLASIRQACEAGGGRVSATTVVSAASWVPILAAAGTSLAAADAVLSGESRVAYALVRPPGHHAQPAQADGYCFVNHAALVAERARANGVERVAIVDWDVHHGNGTQECFWTRADVLTASLHMQHGAWGPTHPQTGAAGEVGFGDGAGFNVNLELGLGAGDATYAAALDEVVTPVLRAFRPGLLVGACGQDASAFDPNGRQNVSMAGFRRIGATVAGLAEELCDGRLVLVQEGGYARTYAAFCLHATLEGVLGLPEPLLPDPLAYVPDDPARGRAGIGAARTHLAPYWRF